MIPNIYTENTERFLFAVTMWTILTNFLITETPSECSTHQLRIAQGFETFVQTFEQRHEKLNGVLLFPQVNWFALQSTEKCLRFCKLNKINVVHHI